MQYTGERLVPGVTDDARMTQEHLARYVFSMHPYCTHMKVLDVSSGAGYGTQILSYAANEVWGVDRDREAVEYARQTYGNSKTVFIVSDATALWETCPHDFDTVVSFETIEHLKYPEAFVDAVSRVLKPGGLFIVSAPENSGSTWHEKDYTKGDLQMTLLRGHPWVTMRYAAQNFGDESIIELDGVACSEHPTHLFICRKRTSDDPLSIPVGAMLAADPVHRESL